MPLCTWADAELAALQLASRSDGLAGVGGAMLMSERAAINAPKIPGATSALGSCRFYTTRDGHIAINLARPDDCDLLPALFGEADVPSNLTELFRRQTAAGVVAKGRELGMAIAALDETPVSPASIETVSCDAHRDPARSPLVIDLSALWAGPLASRLLRLAGARVVSVESASRRDAMRDSDPTFSARLNDGKDRVSLDLRTDGGRAELGALIARADIVIDAARPRAILQLGINPDRMVCDHPGLVWISITGHGIAGDASNWVAFGDDAGVAGGLSAALHNASGSIGFVGDAIGDPLTGIHAARLALEAQSSGHGTRIVVSMSGVVGEAIAWERERDAAAFDLGLKDWKATIGRSWLRC